MSYLSHAVSSTGNRKIFTISAWIKCDINETNKTIFGAGTAGSNTGKFYFAISSGQIRIGGGASVYLVSDRLLRDASSWYHVVCAFDTSQGTAANRIKFYINGQQITSNYSTANYPTQDQNTPVNESGKQNTFGAEQGGGEQWKGYMTHMVLVDGAQLTPSNFGETDASTGSWKPKPEPTGVTYGTNGVFMKCENSGNLGLDSSGQTNNYTANSFNTNAQTSDNASNNFATLNPTVTSEIQYYYNNLLNGNLRNATTLGGNNRKGWPAGTLAVNKGKWYAEYFCEYISSQNASGGPGIYDYDFAVQDYNGVPCATAGGILYDPYGRIRSAGSDAGSYPTWTTNDIIGIYMDLDNNELRFSKNGTLINSGNSVATITHPSSAPGNDYWTFCPYDESSNAFDASMNFGQPNSYFGSCTNADNAGFGKFKYSPSISGTHYYSLCTKNINTYG
tara:strand:+ start:124 stop:1470 length:1347 start_codon:yes stop_codon:yes gene_type:complete